jgi:FKBP-type peptidyl-prolyl cis-trans isomerase
VNCENKSNKQIIDSKELSDILLDANKLQIAYDTLRAISFIRLNNWNMQQTKTGVWYEIIDSVNGVPINEDDIVTIEYTVRLMDGALCYSSMETGPKTFKVKLGSVENGLEDGIVLLKGGDSARFVMPQFRAHHLLGDGKKIPPLTTIIYNLRVIEVAKEKK